MSRKPTSPQRGGGNVKLYANVGVDGGGDPEHVRDVSLLQRAHAVLDRQTKAAFASGDEERGRKTGNILRTVKNVSREMSDRPYMRLTQNQRVMCMKIIGITELPPLSDATPAVLLNLPKKPPMPIRKDTA